MPTAIALESSLGYVVWGPDLYWGLAAGIGEDSRFVKGVRLLTFRGPPKVDILDRGAGALKPDDTVLECELAEPTPLSRSPWRESLSSASGGHPLTGGGLISPPERDEDEAAAASSARGGNDSDTLVSATGRMLGESSPRDLTFSLSFALSLAARGAEGKNCAKLAPDARDIVRQRSIYRSRRLPTNISDLGIIVRPHASEPQ